MLYFTKRKGDCTGCGACYFSCPVHCINMEKDEEGFYYPVATNNCIHCGRCEQVCPIMNPNDLHMNQVKQKAYCARSKHYDVWQKSASGGAFSEICRGFCNGSTVICAAAWDGFDVHHICVEGFENIAPLRKSKYIASKLENVVFELRDAFGDGKRIVFCGTPCQVEGVKRALGEQIVNSEYCLFIDLICHGVGSEDVFHACINDMEKHLGHSIDSYEFRAKNKTWQTDYLSQITITDKKESKYLIDDQYIQLFLKQLCLRPSCGKNCRYRCAPRAGDITIADFKGLAKVYPELAKKRINYSSIIVNTMKGMELMDVLNGNMVLRECNLEDIKRYNPLFYKNTWFSEERETFFCDFIDNPAEAIDKWTVPAKVSHRSIKRKAFDMLFELLRKTLLLKKVYDFYG